MNCPNCDSSSFYYVQRVYEYHRLDNVTDGCVELIHLEDAAIDEGYVPHIRCEHCGMTYDLDLVVINLAEEDEPCPPTKFEVMHNEDS